MTTSFKKIDHINIVVQDLEEAKIFFLELDFTITHTGILTGKWIDTLTQMKNVKAEYASLQLSKTETKLELLKFYLPRGIHDSKKNILNQIGLRHIAFEVEDIEKVVAKLKTKGVHFLSEIQEYKQTNKKLCYFEGPEGIILELAEYKKNKP
jgi:catechol 2,3-dioxygenase-like lactoylglutathione lyase family enzyme